MFLFRDIDALGLLDESESKLHDGGVDRGVQMLQTV